MSIDSCKSCGRLVDTDFDPECYYASPDSDEITACTCQWCREEDARIGFFSIGGGES